VADRLFAEPFAFDFFQAVRLLQQLYPARAPVGGASPPAAEVVRFRGHVSLNFPPSAVYDLQRPGDPPGPPVLSVAFMGLAGTVGVLPRHYTEVLLRVERESKAPERFALRAWLDLFNHRALSQFFRAWEKYRFPVTYERRERTGSTEPDAFSGVLFSLIGIGMPALRNRLRVASREDEDGRPRERVLAQVHDLALAYYGGLLAHRPRCAAGLEGMLHDYFQLPVQVQQFHGQWLQLDPANQSRLGDEAGNTQLGVNLVAGERVWDVQGKVRIRLGPLDHAAFTSFLPDRSPVPQRKQFFALVHLVRLYVGPELAFDVQLALRPEDVPECRLPEGTADGPRLGWNSWVRSQSFARPAEEAVFEGEEIVWVNE
jgi:type VI secretion system protein ImpH